MRIFSIFRSPEGEGGGGSGTVSIESVVSEAVGGDAGGSGDSGQGDAGRASDAVDTGKKEEKSSVESKWDGKDRRKAADADPEYELDFEMEEGKGKSKLKLSELKESVKFLHENKRTIASTFKIREMAEKNPEFGKLLNTVLEKSFSGDKYNGEYVANTLKTLEGKVENVQEKIDAKDESIDDLQGMLDELDPESPQAKVLKRSIQAQKNQLSQLKATRDQLNDVKNRVDGIEKAGQDAKAAQDKSAHQAEVKRLSQMFEKEIDALSKDGAAKFIDDDEKADFIDGVKKAVSSNSAKVKSDEEFLKLIQDSAKDVLSRLTKRREAYVNEYIRTKSGNSKNDKKKDESASSSSVGDVEGDIASLISEATEEVLSSKK